MPGWEYFAEAPRRGLPRIGWNFRRITRTSRKPLHERGKLDERTFTMLDESKELRETRNSTKLLFFIDPDSISFTLTRRYTL